VIPLDATLIKGSHGRVGVDEKYKPVLITDNKTKGDVIATDVFDIIYQHLKD